MKKLEDIINQSAEILSGKSKEYAIKGRYYNFEQASNISGEPVLKCLLGMAMKHLVCVIDIRERYLDAEYKDEKCGDLINYMILAICYIKRKENIDKVDVESILNLAYTSAHPLYQLEDLWKELLDNNGNLFLYVDVIQHCLDVWGCYDNR